MFFFLSNTNSIARKHFPDQSWQLEALEKLYEQNPKGFETRQELPIMRGLANIMEKDIAIREKESN